MYVVQLSEVDITSLLAVGGKGANLGELVKGGFPVPQGFCVTSSAYNKYIEENQFSKVIEAILAEIYTSPEKGGQLAAKLGEKLRAGKMPPDIYYEIESFFHQLPADVPLAVRSSATAEDLPEASFAGQQDTYLNIRGLENLMTAIKSCFASLWTERAIAYRKNTGFDRQKVSLAVVVQEMVDSDISGVLFTVNPVNGEGSEMMVNASYGLGEAIVSGRVTPDTFIWNKVKASIKSRSLGSKEIAVIYDLAGGTVQQQNTKLLREKYCMTDKQLNSLTTIAEKIEKHYGAPQDIEWAIKGNKIYILQSRSITTLNSQRPTRKEPTSKRQNKRERMMMNNLVEHWPSPPYPLDYQPICGVLKGKTETMEVLGVKMTQDRSLILRDNGEFEIHSPTMKITSAIFRIPFRIKEYRNFKRNQDATQAVLQEIRPRLNELELINKMALPVSVLADTIRELLGIADKLIYIRFRYNIYPGVLTGKFIGLQLKKLSPVVSQYDIFSDLHYKTWDMNVEISELSMCVNQIPRLKAAVLAISENDNVEDQLSKIAKDFPQFGAVYHHIMKKYGWKSTSTYLAFSSISWNEDRKYFLTLLKIAMERDNAVRECGKYHTLCKQIQSSLSKERAGKLIAQMEESRVYHQNREESLYLLEMCYGICRTLAKEIAARYPETFVAAADINFLTLDEVYALCSGIPTGTVKKIAARKKSMAANRVLWNKMELQSMKTSEKQLKGISGNMGKVRGKVCIIQEVSEFEKLNQGDILVCKYTDPMWTPLFTIAKAVVSDTGGPLSHSAIVAREYNIPAVLGCGNATRTLVDGQEIIVDGDKGIVEIIG